jgi:2,4-dienoyl-CoA reductase-like NADH-dependent reductase (Old Yellow Enzyme family)
MWRPPQRIKWKPAPGRWPTREEAARSLLFSPVAIGAMRLESRTWVPAMVPWRATEEGFITDENLEWYERFARGKPGAIVVEATGIRDIPSGPLLRIGHDRFLPGLKELVQTVCRASDGHTRLLIQIIDFLAIRRRPDPERFFARFLEIQPWHRERLGAESWPEDLVRRHLAQLPDDELARVLETRELEALRFGHRERVTDMDLAHIRALPQVLPDLFAQAARRAREAGFDGVELHYAHAYTMASFLSRLNDRADGYGGPREHRVRLPLEVFRHVRATVGDDYPVGCRFLSEESIAGGNTVEDTAWFGVEFARAGMDFLSLSRGGKFEDAKQPAVGWSAYPYTGPSGYECMPQYVSDERGPFGRNVEPTASIHAAVRAAGCGTPVIVTGGMHGFEQAEALLRAGRADVVGFARQSLADPDWFEKVRLGYGAEARICEYTNYCEALDQKHQQVTCQLWDREALDEPGVRKTQDGKRRLVAPLWTPPATR